jgi:hypothetical protein
MRRKEEEGSCVQAVDGVGLDGDDVGNGELEDNDSDGDVGGSGCVRDA